MLGGFPLFTGELPPPVPKRKPGDAKPKGVPSELASPPQLLCSLPGEKHPMMFIHEMYPTTECTVKETPDDQGLFSASLSVEGQAFEVNISVHSKKEIVKWQNRGLILKFVLFCFVYSQCIVNENYRNSQLGNP